MFVVCWGAPASTVAGIGDALDDAAYVCPVCGTPFPEAGADDVGAADERGISLDAYLADKACPTCDEANR